MTRRRPTVPPDALVCNYTQIALFHFPLISLHPPTLNSTWVPSGSLACSSKTPPAGGLETTRLEMHESRRCAQKEKKGSCGAIVHLAAPMTVVSLARPAVSAEEHRDRLEELCYEPSSDRKRVSARFLGVFGVEEERTNPKSTDFGPNESPFNTSTLFIFSRKGTAGTCGEKPSEEPPSGPRPGENGIGPFCILVCNQLERRGRVITAEDA